MTDEQKAEQDLNDLRRIRRWAEAHEPGQSMTVSRDLVLQLVAQAEVVALAIPPGGAS